jgi:nitroreductase
MDALECIKSRQSIRAFTKEPVPEATIKAVVETARWSPSYKNSQPWEVMVVSGEKKQALSNMMIELIEKDTEPHPDLPAPESWPEREQANVDGLYKMRKDAMGIDLSNPEVIKKAKKANFRFYNAPHAVYLFQDSSLSPWSIFDMGLFAQNFMLAAHAMGLGTVPQAFVTDYAAEIKSFLGIPANKRLILGFSLGYPDMDSPANRMRTARMKADEIVTFTD